MSTYLQLVQNLQEDVGVAGTVTSVSDTRVDISRLARWISQAYREIQASWLDWNWLWGSDSITTANGQATYNPPADLASWAEDTFYIGTDPLEYIPYDDYRREKEAWTTSGQPTAFTIQPDEDVRLLPTPDGIYTVDHEYYKGGVDLSVNTDEPLIPARYQDIIHHRAKMFWAEFENSPEEYQQAASNFDILRRQLEANQLPTKDNAHGRNSGVDITVVPE